MTWKNVGWNRTRKHSFTANKTVQEDSNANIMVTLSKGKGNKKRSAIEAVDCHSDDNSAYYNLELSPSPKKVSNRD